MKSAQLNIFSVGQLQIIHTIIHDFTETVKYHHTTKKRTKKEKIKEKNENQTGVLTVKDGT